MNLLAKYTSVIEEGLQNLNLPQNPSNLYEPIGYILKLGGKRIRPILTLMGAEMFGAMEASVHQALSVEMFHNFTLIHDDIMDAAPLRRGEPTVHHKWDTNIGILSGDALLVKSYQELIKADSNHIQSLMELFNKTALEVCEGQQMDMDFEQRNDVTIAEYIEMIRLKTSVLLGCALQMGAIVSGASEKDQNEIYQFGQKLGIAFQIQDDILDLYADPEKFGKQVGGDVVANKKTILFLTAQSKSNSDQLSILKQLHSEEDTMVKVNRITELFNHLNVRQSCEDLKEQYHQEAMQHLSNIKVDDDRKQVLIKLSETLLTREV